MLRTIALLLVGLSVPAGLAGPAMAQCSPIPNVLTNGTNADATQVMANFNGIVSCPLFTGNVGIGTANPAAKLQVMDTLSGISTGIKVAPYHMVGIAAGTELQAVDADGTTLRVISLNASGGSVSVGTLTPGFVFSVNGSSGGTDPWSISSDLRLKKDIEPLTGALDLVLQLRGVRYQWREPAEREIGRDLRLTVGRPQLGFIAQEVENVLPAMVDRPKQEGGTYALRETVLLPVLVEAIKEQQQQIEDLRHEINALRTRTEASLTTGAAQRR
jgi:hypothetical protein